MSSSAPPSLTPLLGRDAERARLEALLTGDARWVTLLGPPGIGKTRLAVEALRAHERAGTRVAWVDLSTTARPEELCARVAHGLGLRLSWLGGGDQVDELGYAIAGQGPTLLVLDEADASRVAVGEVVPRWLAGAPDARALVTSRSRVGVAGEVPLELGPLEVDLDDPLASASGRLLLAHAGLARPERPSDAEALAELVRALDGIPLAIELVAARLRVLAPDEILSRFAQRGLGALDGARPREGAPLRAALEASWQRLGDEDQRALARCAIFVGDFDTEAAEAVLGPDAVDRLQSLRDQSLLARRDGRHRLYAPVRAFAAERLVELASEGEAAQAHAAFFAGRADALRAELNGPGEPRAIRRLTRDLDQLRGAHARASDPACRRALALGVAEVLVTRGPAQDALALLPAASDAETGRLRARALEVVGRVEEALDELTRALEVRADDAGRAWLYAQAAALELARGNLDAAGAHAEEACALAPDGDPSRVEAIRRRAVVAHARGALEAAVDDYERARRLADELGLNHRGAQLRVDIGAVRLQERRFDEAREHYEAAVAQIDPRTDPVALGLAEGNLAILEQEQGRLERAAELLARGLARLRRTGHRLFVAHLGAYAGVVEHERGALDPAVGFYQEALDGLRRVGDARLTALVAAVCGAAEAGRGRLRAAEERFDEAAEALARVEDPGVHRAVALHRHQLAIARSDDARGAAAEAVARGLTDPVVERSDDARIALRLLAARLGHGAITIDADACSLTLPDGAEVELASRLTLWRLVHALAEARGAGQALDPHALIEAGWPGESPTGASGLNRVKVALSTLRKLGLREILIRSHDGYSFDPAVPLRWKHRLERGET